MNRTVSHPSSVMLYKRLLRYVLPYRMVFGLGILAMVAVAATEPLFPGLIKAMLDKGFSGTSAQLAQRTLTIPLLIVGVFALRGALTFVSHYCLAWVGGRILLDLREEMFAKLLKLPAPYFDNQASGQLISRITHDVNGVTSAATSALTIVVRDSLTVIALLGYLLYLNWKLTLVALAIVPPLVFFIRIFSTRLRSMSRESQFAMGDIAQTVQEGVEAHRVIKVYGGQEYESKRFFKASNRLRSLNMKQSVAASAMVPITQLCVSVAIAVVVFIALMQAASTGFSVGSFAAFLFAMLMLLNPIKHLADVNAPLQRGLAAAESVFSLIDQLPEDDHGKNVLQKRSHGEIRFDAVSFAYLQAHRPALDKVSFVVEPGKTLALVGPSGGGKSTISHLIGRFYDPQSGRVLLDGTDICELTRESLRQQIAMVSQDVVLFNDTIAANIAYGLQRHATEDEIWAAARAAHADGFIHELPDKLNSMVGEKGIKLSGGQRQRLAIARALLKDAPILVLDEATSALDSESERHVQQALDKLMQGRTTIVIAHRLSTIERADRIAVLDWGKLIESGTHAELLAQNGVYANLYRIQYALGHD
jgi:ATP-binding cassette, subfamily B, bacterial MsbA